MSPTQTAVQPPPTVSETVTPAAASPAPSATPPWVLEVPLPQLPLPLPEVPLPLPPILDLPELPSLPDALQDPIDDVLALLPPPLQPDIDLPTATEPGGVTVPIPTVVSDLLPDPEDSGENPVAEVLAKVLPKLLPFGH
jgi:hypothetical protein